MGQSRFIEDDIENSIVFLHDAKFFDGVTVLKHNTCHDELGRFCSSPGAGSATSTDTAIASEPHAPPPPGQFYNPDVSHDANGDGVADFARVGVPGDSVPPPPAKIPRLPNLTAHERQAEENFAKRFETDPDGMAKAYREGVLSTGKTPTFETDAAKLLSPDWNDADPALQVQKRSHFNTALHQTANAIAKRAFVQHLDTLPPESEILVTVGGCAAGKGMVIRKSGEAAGAMARAAVIWDSAGDQNATENAWVLREATKRNLKVTYLYVHADAKASWMDRKGSVVKRALNPNNGRMVDAAVFADSHALGAVNHNAFHKQHKSNPRANFLFLDNTAGEPKLMPEMPKSAFIDRKELYDYAVKSIIESDHPAHVKRGALTGKRIWQ